MSNWKETLRSLADTPEDFSFQEGLVLFQRHGEEVVLRIKDIPAVGPCVVEGSLLTAGDCVPVDEFVQRDVLRLPRLAEQIQRAVQRHRQGTRLRLRFVDGPASIQRGGEGDRDWPHVFDPLRSCLLEKEGGTTHVVQLMARAGAGKTVLLEELAERLASEYMPAQYPIPLLLPVDLLGRYVGNFEDALAGSLDNAYKFPSLTFSDVLLCLRRGWLIVAMDGFDELTARVGVRDAFLRVSELLDQLDGAGTLVLSARDTFFEENRIVSGIRAYLNPTKGTFSTSVVTLRPWSRNEASDVFQALGAEEPASEAEALLEMFEGDRDIVFHPFFLTQLAALWIEGERFVGASKSRDPVWRAQYVIERFLEREARKWTDDHDQMLIPPEEHSRVLGAIAVEMWGGSAFNLRPDELRLATEIALGDSDLSQIVRESVVQRVATHGVFATRGEDRVFISDCFLEYFLAHRISWLASNQAVSELARAFAAREFSPIVSAHIVAFMGEADVVDAFGVLRKIRDVTARDHTVQTNLGALVARLGGREGSGESRFAGWVFSGVALRGARFSGARFDNCRFWMADLSAAEFRNCEFVGCEISDTSIDADTSFRGSSFSNSTFKSLDDPGSRTYYVPEEISRVLEAKGATSVSHAGGESKRLAETLPDDLLRCIDRFVRVAARATFISVDEVGGTDDACREHAHRVAKIGVRSGALRTAQRHTSGAKKELLRFAVDREAFLRGQTGDSGVREIDAFWTHLREYVRKRS